MTRSMSTRATASKFSYPSAEDLAATRDKLLAAQDEIVKSTRMDLDYVSKVQARLKELQN